MLLAEGDDVRGQRIEDAGEPPIAVAVPALAQNAVRRAAEAVNGDRQLALGDRRRDHRHEIGDRQGQGEKAVGGAERGEQLPQRARRLEIAEAEGRQRVAGDIEHFHRIGRRLGLGVDDAVAAAEEDQPPAEPQADEPDQRRAGENERAGGRQQPMAALAAIGDPERQPPRPLHGPGGERAGAAGRQGGQADFDDGPGDEGRAEKREKDHGECSGSGP